MLKQLLIAIDQVFNVLIGSHWADETLSAYAHRTGGWRRTVINGLFFWHHDHCFQAFESERLRRQLPSAYKN